MFVQGRVGGLPSEFNDRHVGYCLGSIDCRSSILSGREGFIEKIHGWGDLDRMTS